MNLMEESFQNREEIKKKKTTTIILIAIILVVIIIIAIMGYLMYLKSTVMELTIDGQESEKLKSLLVFEDDGMVYAPIKEIAAYFGYESYNGEYTEKSEEQSKCYVQNQNEVANFELGQNKIYKLDLTQSNSDYEYVYMKNPVKAINGVLYVSTEGLEKAFNLSFNYDQQKNTITIFTMPYLYRYYANKVLDYGYVELDSEFRNQKAILHNQLIVLKDKNNKQYGVIGVDGTVILEPKYDNITYLLNTGDFLVETNKKVGIMSANRETKVQIIYDSIELMDSDAGLYIAKKDNKYGMIDIKGNIKIYIENDAIGIDISKFSQNNIKNKYILADNLIPVKKDKYWGLYDKSGNQVVEYKYDSLGYIASSNKDAINLLVIPNYNVLVACKDKKYTLVNTSGSELFSTIADDIYMTISGGERHYYISVNDQIIDAEEWLNRYGITGQPNTTNQTQNSTTNEDNNNREDSNNQRDNTAEPEREEQEQQNDNNGDNEEQRSDYSEEGNQQQVQEENQEERQGEEQQQVQEQNQEQNQEQSQEQSQEQY